MNPMTHQAAPILLIFLCDVHKLRECRCIGNGEIGKHLAVDLDPCIRQPRNKAAVRDAVRTRCCIDARDPETVSFAFLNCLLREPR